MALLSEACATVSTPKFFSNIFEEQPIQPGSRYDIGKKTASQSRQGFVPTHKREVGNKDQGVMRDRIEMQRSDHWESDVGSRNEVERGVQGRRATIF